MLEDDIDGAVSPNPHLYHGAVGLANLGELSTLFSHSHSCGVVKAVGMLARARVESGAESSTRAWSPKLCHHLPLRCCSSANVPVLA